MAGTKIIAAAVSKIEAEAYKRGYDDGLRAAMQAVKDLRPKRIVGETGNITIIPQAAQLTLDTVRPRVRLRPKSDQARVFEMIRSRPGLRGVEIVRALQESDNPVHERTVRTSLSRLKRHGFIMQKDEGWYEIGTGQAG